MMHSVCAYSYGFNHHISGLGLDIKTRLFGLGKDCRWIQVQVKSKATGLSVGFLKTFHYSSKKLRPAGRKFDTPGLGGSGGDLTNNRYVTNVTNNM